MMISFALCWVVVLLLLGFSPFCGLFGSLCCVLHRLADMHNEYEQIPIEKCRI